MNTDERFTIKDFCSIVAILWFVGLIFLAAMAPFVAAFLLLVHFLK